MKVSIALEDGPFETLVERRVDDSKRAGRHWTPVEADLAAWAGQRVTLRLELVPDRAIARREEISWWGSPRIAGPPASGRPPPARAQIREPTPNPLEVVD
jgi:hypothetical protein